MKNIKLTMSKMKFNVDNKINHNQVGFILEMQKQFNIKKKQFMKYTLTD